MITNRPLPPLPLPPAPSPRKGVGVPCESGRYLWRHSGGCPRHSPSLPRGGGRGEGWTVPLLWLFAFLVAGCAPRGEVIAAQFGAGPLFSEAERRAVVAYWSQPGRYAITPSPEVFPTWQGRQWIEAARKTLPLSEVPRFEDWLKARQAYDVWLLEGERGTPPPAPGSPPIAAGAPPEPLHASDRANLSVPGSVWHWNYNRFRDRYRESHPAAAGEIAVWETWITNRVAYDKGKAGGGPPAPHPGPMPSALKAGVGEPPALFERVRPQRYTVTFAPGDAAAPFVYTDNLARPDRYAYYRSTKGVVRWGRPLVQYTGEEKRRMEALFARAGKNAFERNVLQAVSRLEGGFDAVNTYDTGFISIGFIQFITAEKGTGSLGGVLLQHKASDPADYQATFRRFGIDVAPDGVIVAVDPATGQELRGADAVRRIIDDKRLTAIFERAGNLDGFRLAQVRVARARYWPGDDPVTVPVTTVYEQAGGESAAKVVGTFYGATDAQAQARTALARQQARKATDPNYRSWVETRTWTARVADLVRSEAGMATLMDRKVNRGHIRGISDVAAALLKQRKVAAVEDLSKSERALVEAMKYRAAFLEDPTLSQPSKLTVAPAP